MQILDPHSGDSLAGTSVITIGKFDGVHRGHQALLREARREAEAQGSMWGVATFDRHPMEILRPQTITSYLTLLPDKLHLLEEAGASFCVLMKPDSGILQWTAEDFIHRVIRQTARAHMVITGDDFQFGRNRSGSVETLREAGRRDGFKVQIVPPVLVDSDRVSSYAIRQALLHGDLPRAEAMLGRRYTVSGPVLRGRQLGRVLGYPTANVGVDPRAALPAMGIYAVTATWDGLIHHAVASLGVRPTVEEGPTDLWLEVYVLDWAGDLYEKYLEVAFVRRLRDEVRFPSLDALKDQIGRDVEAARSIFRTS